MRQLTRPAFNHGSGRNQQVRAKSWFDDTCPDILLELRSQLTSNSSGHAAACMRECLRLGKIEVLQFPFPFSQGWLAWLSADSVRRQLCWAGFYQPAARQHTAVCTSVERRLPAVLAQDAQWKSNHCRSVVSDGSSSDWFSGCKRSMRMSFACRTCKMYVR